MFPGCSNNLGSPSASMWKDYCCVTFYYLILAWYWEEKNEKAYWNWWKAPRKREFETEWQDLGSVPSSDASDLISLSQGFVWKLGIILLFLLSFAQSNISKMEDVFDVLPNKNWPQNLAIGSRSPNFLLRWMALLGNQYFFGIWWCT